MELLGSRSCSWDKECQGAFVQQLQQWAREISGFTHAAEAGSGLFGQPGIVMNFPAEWEVIRGNQ